jgi:hypothetical protein
LTQRLSGQAFTATTYVQHFPHSAFNPTESVTAGARLVQAVDLRRVEHEYSHSIGPFEFDGYLFDIAIELEWRAMKTVEGQVRPKTDTHVESCTRREVSWHRLFHRRVSDMVREMTTSED